MERERTLDSIVKKCDARVVSRALFSQSADKKVQKRTSQTEEYSKTTAFLKLGRLDEALQQVSELLRTKPQDEQFLCLKGKVLEKMNCIEEADSCYQEALKSNSQRSKAAYLKAAIENKRGNYDKAIELYQVALKKDKRGTDPSSSASTDLTKLILDNEKHPGTIPLYESSKNAMSLGEETLLDQIESEMESIKQKSQTKIKENMISISTSVGFAFSSQETESPRSKMEYKEVGPKEKKARKKKSRTTTANFANFSDRCLSSKFYKVKKHQINLFGFKRTNSKKRVPPPIIESLNNSESNTSLSIVQKFINRSSPPGKKR